jgi:hypothetical protein
MKKFKVILILIVSSMLVTSCSDQLDVKNPNQPTTDAITSENNITSLGLGIYASGFRGVKYGGFQGTFVTDVLAFHEIMGDVIGIEAANLYVNQIGMPDWVMLDNGSKVTNPATPSTQLSLIRTVNISQSADQNPIYYEWGYMYSLINSCNAILKNVDNIIYQGDQDSKKNTLKAWAYWWKAFAYSRIGSLYYAGIIINEPYPAPIVHDYVSKEAMIIEANANLDKATTALNSITVAADYNTMIGNLIPSFFKVGKGSSPTVASWKRSINTMKARNLLVNTKTSAMTTADWNTILTLTASGTGLGSTDNVFLAKSNATGDFMSAGGGNVANITAGGDPSTTTYKISERFIQDMKTGDKRMANNFTTASGGKWIGNSDRGNIFNTRYRLTNNTTGIGSQGASVIVWGNRTAGFTDVYLGPTWEENELMKAEANIYLGNLTAAATSIDAVRNAQGAGLSATLVPDLATAKEELRKERRIGLAFRALAFYDARRWGVIDPIASGGGRTKAIVVDKTGVLNTNATINYGYLDYWDVPDNEIVYNTPSAASAPVKNPRTN